MKELAERYIYKDGRLISKVTGNFGDTQLNSAGYRRVSWDRGNKGRVRELAHKVIWYIHNGPVPDGMFIDHININHLDNRIENLRLVTRAGNSQNVRRKGYCWARREGKFVAYITVDKKFKHLGYFDKEEDAREAYLTAKRKLHVYASEHVLN